jgi:hypothetical protein
MNTTYVYIKVVTEQLLETNYASSARCKSTLSFHETEQKISLYMAMYSLQLHVDCTDAGTTCAQFILKSKPNQQPKFSTFIKQT